MKFIGEILIGRKRWQAWVNLGTIELFRSEGHRRKVDMSKSTVNETKIGTTVTGDDLIRIVTNIQFDPFVIGHDTINWQDEVRKFFNKPHIVPKEYDPYQDPRQLRIE